MPMALAGVSSHAGLSLGRSQRGESAEALSPCRLRASGGGAVLLGPWLLRAVLLLPAGHPRLQPGPAAAALWFGALHRDWLRGHGIDAICHALKLDFAELARRVADAQPLVTELTPAQERAVRAEAGADAGVAHPQVEQHGRWHDRHPRWPHLHAMAVLFQPRPRTRAPGRCGGSAQLASCQLGVHLGGPGLVEVVVAHDPHRQQRAEDRHAGVEEAQAVHSARGLRGGAGHEADQRHDRAAEQTRDGEAELHHPPVDGAEDALAALAGGELV